MNYTYCFHRICIRRIQSELLVAGRLFEHLKWLILFYEVTWLKWCSKWMISHGKNAMLIWIYCIISLGCINPCLHTIAKPPYFVALFFYSILHKLIHEKVSNFYSLRCLECRIIHTSWSGTLKCVQVHIFPYQVRHYIEWNPPLHIKSGSYDLSKTFIFFFLFRKQLYQNEDT